LPVLTGAQENRMPANTPSILDDDAAAEAQRSAFNAAFYELGLRWYWGSDAYRALAAVACERSRLRSYMQAEQAHLLRAYDADFLTDAILAAKRRRLAAMGDGVSGFAPQCNSADPRWGEIGV
jgi:hypothetical protein